ncbi:MAG: gliding motility-associated C-terminal domain-containing protein, partial [Bacteroidota bacterium]
SGNLVAGTVVNQNNGVLDLTASGTGPHAVYYTSPGPCPTTSGDSLRILNGFNGFFQMERSAICSFPDSIVAVDTVAFDSVPFSSWYSEHADPNNITDSLVFFPGTGDVNLAASAITGRDTFNIFHVVGGGNNCRDTIDQKFIVHEYDFNLSIDYPADTFCPIGGDTLPTVNSIYSGTFDPSPGLSMNDNSTGAINLSNSVDGREYIIRFHSEDGLCDVTTADTIFIRNLDSPNFLFASNFVCHQDTIISPTSVATSTGVFSWVSQNINQIGNLVFVDSTTGTIDIGASVPGPYLLTYTTAGECPNALTQPFTVVEQPDIDALEIEPNDSICLNEPVEVTVPISGIVDWYLNGTWTDDGQSFVSSSLTGVNYLEAVLTENGCSDTAGTFIVVNEKPEVIYVQFPYVMTGSTPIEIELGSTQNNTHIRWWVRQNGDFEVDSLNGVSDTIDVGETTFLTNMVDLTSDFTPVELIYYFEPTASGCLGDVDSIPIAINPNDQEIFVPELLTPNGDGINDVWEIQLLPDLDPTAYSIDLYNRAGAKVYTHEDLAAQWDGGGLPDGVYWWVLRPDDAEAILAGGLTIRRR